MVARALVVLFLAVAPAAPADLPGPSAELAARSDAIFTDFDRPGRPGCALGVMRDGELAYARGYGHASLEWDVPITPQTVFDIASISKQFAAAVTILLAMDGKLSLDDDVRRWIPELPDYGKRITIRHLVHHTSGLRDTAGLFALAGMTEEDAVVDDGVLAMVVRQRRLNHDPGAEFVYCNTGYFMLSLVAKRATGKTLRILAEERIFGPLGMISTRFLDDHAEVVARRATPYEPGVEGRFRVAMNNADFVGDGGVLTTVEDLARWQRNFAEPRVGGPAFVAAMLDPGVLLDGTVLEYASGLFVREHRGLRVVRHRGTAGGYRSDVLRFPDQRLDVIVLCNYGGAAVERLSETVADLWIEGAPPPHAAPPAGTAGLQPAEIATRTGRYREPESGDQRQVVARHGNLYLPFAGAERELVPEGDAEFRIEGLAWKVRVIFDGPRFRWVPALGRPLVFERFEPVKPTASDLRSLAGRYRSEELDAIWTLSFEDGALFRRVRFGAPKSLVPALRDEFRSDGAVLRFRRDARGRSTGFLVNYGRMRHIEFVRLLIERPPGPAPRAPPAGLPAR